MTHPTPPPSDLRLLAYGLGMELPPVAVDWNRVRSRFLLPLLARLPGAAAATAARLHQRRLAGDEPSTGAWSADPMADSAADRIAERAEAMADSLPEIIAERAQQRLDLLAAIRAEAAASAAAHHTTTNDR